MASGYLGKISAVISANTGDYVRKLNESAKETRAFASSVQSALRRASSDAGKSLESIFTPLQKVERALRAAASQKLSFRGFDGAINDVQSLQKALAKLSDQKTIDLVVKTTGVGSLEELKRTISVLRNQDVTVGVEGLRQQRAALGSTNNFVVSTEVRDEAARLDAVIEALERIDAERIKQISIQVEDAQLTAATTQFRRLTELSTQVGGPLSKVQSEFSGLSGAIQAQFIPVLAQAQNSYEQFKQRIEQNSDVAASEFRGLADDVKVVENAIARLRETAAAGGKLFTGEELTFVRPQVVDELDKLAAAQQKLAAAPASVRGSPIARELLADGQVVKGQIDRISARIERLNAQGLDIRFSQAGLDLAYRRLQDIVNLTEQIASPEQPPEIRIDVDIADLENSAKQLQAAFVGRITAIDTAWDQAVRGLTGSTDDIDRRFLALARTIESLDIGDRVDLDPAIAAFRNAVVAGEGYARQLELLSQLEQQVGEKQSFNAMQGNPTGTFGPPKPPRDPGLDLGTDIASPQRALESLRGSIGSVKGQIDSLPAGLRAQFIPAIQGAEAEYRRLFTTVGVTADEIQDSASRLAGIEQNISRASSAARQFGGTFAQFRDSIDARGAAGGLEFLRTALSRATGDATIAAAAVDRLAEAYQEAASTPGGFQRNAADLQRRANEAIEATAAVEGVGQSQASLQRGFARTGDVARGAFGNAGLAIQQAAFAFEDFFSVTGGLDQRIRAAGNNISQLGFILGGTTGLIVGISASIGAQLVASLIKWYNEGRTTEDQTKALNDALARQKSLVEDLRQAFESLGDAIADRAFSEPAQQARKFAKELDDVAKKQKELRERRVADLDEGVQRERATQNRINRELQTETNAGRRVVLQRDLAESVRRERAAAADATGRRVTGDEVGAAVERAILRFLNSGTTAQQRRANAGPVAEAAADVRRGIPVGSRPEDIRAQRAAIETQIAIMRPAANQGDMGALAAIADLEQVLRALELPLQEAFDELSNQILRASRGAALTIESAQQDVADAIRRGVPGAALLQQNLDNIANELDAAQQRLRDAQISDGPDREQQIALAERDIAGIRAREDAIAEAARDVRLTSGRGGDRTTAALSAIQGNERFANEYGGLIARLRAAVDAEMEARLANQKAMNGGTDAQKADAAAAYEAAAAVSDMAAAAAEAALAMEQAIGRIRKIGDDALSQSERMADESQRRLNERPTDDNLQRRDEAERQLIRDRERVAQANNALDGRRRELQTSDPRLVQINGELESIRQERRRLDDEAAKNSTIADPEEVQRLQVRETQLLAEREQRLFDLTEAERRQQDAINQEITARRRLVDFMDEVDRRRNPQGDPVRGLDLLESAGERSARELGQAYADIAAASRQAIDLAIREDRLGDIPGIQQREREAQERALQESLRQTAPAIFGLSDQVQNAILQGPSRAALTPTDVSTVEGSRELTRLLRGDDAARDQSNLVELQKQANELLRAIAQNPAGIAP